MLTIARSMRRHGAKVFLWTEELLLRGIEPDRIGEADPERLTEAYVATIDAVMGADRVIAWPGAWDCATARVPLGIAKAIGTPIIEVAEVLPASVLRQAA